MSICRNPCRSISNISRPRWTIRASCNCAPTSMAIRAKFGPRSASRDKPRRSRHPGAVTAHVVFAHPGLATRIEEIDPDNFVAPLLPHLYFVGANSLRDFIFDLIDRPRAHVTCMMITWHRGATASAAL